tara:strand:+ start:4427 stop:5644 length:1218 start_codon:yes stop_codon:yes gene_type:complete
MPPTVFKRNGRKNYYTSIHGIVVSTCEPDQRAALKIAAEMDAVGIEAYRKGKRTLGEYLPDLIEIHLQYLKDVDNRDATHIRKKRQKLTLPIEQGVFKHLKHVTKQTFEPWWQDLSCGPKTRNEYLTAWLVFLDWLVHEGKIFQNPLKNRIKRARVPRQSENDRRALTRLETANLLNIAGNRELVYLLAITTGARKGELKEIRWEDVNENSDPPYLFLRFDTTKNDKRRMQYLTPEAADLLHEARKEASTERLFRDLPNHHTFNKHLWLAGIPKKTSEGIACFHSLRHTFATMVARTTKDPRVAQRMADHADITTTQRYLHTERSEHADVMAQFPSFRTAGRAAPRAVGQVQTGQNESNDGPAKSIVEYRQVSGNEPFRLAESGLVQSSLRMEPGGIEPPCRYCQ